MANPVLVDCPKNVWTKVVTNIITGFLHIKDTTPSVYLQTYRGTGGSAPAAGDPTEGVPIDDLFIPIEATSGIDIYIMPLSFDGVVRVDAV